MRRLHLHLHRVTAAVLLVAAATAEIVAQDGNSIASEGLNHEPQVADLRVAGEGRDRVTFTVRWPNAFCTARNHDAAWIVLRGPDARAPTVRVATHGHRAEGDRPGRVIASADGRGVFVEPTVAFEGSADVEWRVTVALAEAAPEPVTAWAVGMVFVPAGPFEAGDDDPIALQFGALHTVGDDGQSVGPVRIESEAELAVGEGAGELRYRRGQYRGDGAGPVPAAWPKGTRAFYVMRRELSQGLYARFLSALPGDWQAARGPIELQGKETATCSIIRTEAGWRADAPTRPCNFVSWDDTAALMDWLALRPMTELEFEKAARGPRRPVPLDYPWGTAALADLDRRVTPTRDLENATPAAERDLTEATRAPFGASFYRVMDLAGSLWERVVTLGHPKGRAFVGSHGDGRLGELGTATNADWPRQEQGGDAAFGIGYRGGAEYFVPVKAGDPTNPASPVALRTYGAWEGGQRYKTYSARGCRTADGNRPR